VAKENKTDYFTNPFDQEVRLGYCADSWYLRIYVHDGSKVLERTCDRLRIIESSNGYGGCISTRVPTWKDQTLLPMGTGTAKIRENFIALLWPEDIDNTASEVHLFSTENGMLHDYSVGVAPGGVYSLVKSRCE